MYIRNNNLEVKVMNDNWINIANFRYGANFSLRGSFSTRLLGTYAFDKEHNKCYFKQICGITNKKMFLTDACEQDLKITQIAESDLLEGEIAACVFKLDGYEIRSAARIYTDNSPVGFTFEENTPATREQIANMVQPGLISFRWYGFRHVHEISARYVGDNEITDFIPLASAVEGFSWSESLVFIGTAKEKGAYKTNKPILFVKKEWVGDSFGADTWYAMYTDGSISHYERHDMSSDDNRYWEI